MCTWQKQWVDKIVHKIKSTHMWASLLRSPSAGSSAAVATDQSAAHPPHNMHAVLQGSILWPVSVYMLTLGHVNHKVSFNCRASVGFFLETLCSIRVQRSSWPTIYRNNLQINEVLIAIISNSTHTENESIRLHMLEKMKTFLMLVASQGQEDMFQYYNEAAR